MYMHLLPFLESQMTNNTTRVDAVWDANQDTSFKSQTRAKRGETEGRRARFSVKAHVQKGAEWQKYPKDSDNKDELFRLLSEQLVQNTINASYHLLTTKAVLVLSNRPTGVTALSPCHQEEAYTRMMLHVRHAAEQDHTKACLRTVHTDVVVLAIHHFHQPRLSELWIGFSQGRHSEKCQFITSLNSWDLVAARHFSSSIHSQDVM